MNWPEAVVVLGILFFCFKMEQLRHHKKFDPDLEPTTPLIIADRTYICDSCFLEFSPSEAVYGSRHYCDDRSRGGTIVWRQDASPWQQIGH